MWLDRVWRAITNATAALLVFAKLLTRIEYAPDSAEYSRLLLTSTPSLATAEPAPHASRSFELLVFHDGAQTLGEYWYLAIFSGWAWLALAIALVSIALACPRCSKQRTDTGLGARSR